MTCTFVKPSPTCSGSTVGPQLNFSDVGQGADLYRAFNRFGPSRVVQMHHSRLIPPVVVDLGEVVGLIYRSDKGRAGHPQTYIHRMEDPPRLVSDVEGRQLYIVGGSYRITSRGIEG